MAPQQPKAFSQRKWEAEGRVVYVLCLALGVLFIFVGDDFDHYVFAPAMLIMSVVFFIYIERKIRQSKHR